MPEFEWGSLKLALVLPAARYAPALALVIAIIHRVVLGPHDLRRQGPQDEIPWWSLTERVIHGLLIISFLPAAATGYALCFHLGGPGSATRTAVLEVHGWSHLYGIAMAAALLRWARPALLGRDDLAWLLHFGGRVRPPAPLRTGKLNAGQKLWFWLLVVTAPVLVLTGEYLARLPSGGSAFALLSVVHILSATVLLVAFALHAYLATLGVRGVLRGMWDGKASRTAAKRFHSAAPALDQPPPKKDNQSVPGL